MKKILTILAASFVALGAFTSCSSDASLEIEQVTGGMSWSTYKLNNYDKDKDWGGVDKAYTDDNIKDGDILHFQIKFDTECDWMQFYIIDSAWAVTNDSFEGKPGPEAFYLDKDLTKKISGTIENDDGGNDCEDGIWYGTYKGTNYKTGDVIDIYYKASSIMKQMASGLKDGIKYTADGSETTFAWEDNKMCVALTGYGYKIYDGSFEIVK